MPVNFENLMIAMRANMSPAMTAVLVEQLGGPVTAEACDRLGIGHYPAENAWVFPERDETGKIIGLTKRYESGKKIAWKGSKRGLSYECLGVRQKGGDIQPRSFIRVGLAEVPCPICGRENDGCLVSDENPDDPGAVVCVRTSKGAVKSLPGAGHLHHRHTNASVGGRRVQILPVSDRPTVVTEGASDGLAAASIGYVAVGMSQAGAATTALCDLLRGREVIIVGDRDAHGVGQASLESTFQTLFPACKTVVKVLPPEPFKDLRGWGPSAAEFEEHVKAVGESQQATTVLDSDAPYDLVKAWVQSTQMFRGHRIVQCLHEDFYQWDVNKYRLLSRAEIRRMWYTWFSERQLKYNAKDGVKVIDLKPNRHFMLDVDDAARAYCNVQAEDSAHEPLILKTGKSMDLARAVVFNNGIYHVQERQLTPLTPDIFLTTTLPYDYNANALCELWEWFVADIFNGDQECIDLLQEWMGYCLIASNHMQSMMFLFGVPGSGKSTVGKVVEAMLGRARSAAANTNSFKDLFGPAALVNKYVAIMSESRDTNRGDVDKLLQAWKAITGGDTISVRRLYKNAMDARLFCRLMYVANDVLPFDDTSQAMSGRTNLLYFPNNYRASNPDRMLDTKLVAEIQGITLWAIDGLRRLLEQDKFTCPKASEEHLRGIAELTNPIGTMLAECCEYGEAHSHRAKSDVLYDLWLGWCHATRTKTGLSRIAFGMKLRNMQQPLVRNQYMEGGKRFYAYAGISIRDGMLEKYLM
ncbi:MAG: hypothetical protein GY832_31535 [Chloroflexi bacterium]|nr:hypothetical protein [Chloroflexota bacterium]